MVDKFAPGSKSLQEQSIGCTQFHDENCPRCRGGIPMTTLKKKSETNLKDTVATLSTVLGFCIALVSFVLNFQKWMQDPQAFRVTSFVGFLLYGSGSVWFAFRAKNVTTQLRWASLGILYITSILYGVWVGTWLITPAPAPVMIDRMDGVSLWSPYPDGKGSTAAYRLAPGKTSNALELNYTVQKDGYAGVSREISSGILNGTKAIGFTYKGSSDAEPFAANTIELKLLYKPDASGKSSIFGILWNHATDVDRWTSLEAPYNLFICWTATGCQPGETLEPNKVWKIDIAVSNKPGDTPGSGTILIDDVQGLR
jgi:hypothetical protein